jgi:UDP-N-acetylmuramate dehydrogenase
MSALQIVEKQPLSEYSTFRIGGVARYFTRVHSMQDLKEALSFARQRQLSVFFVGNGSNTLFADQGLDGLVIHVRLTELKDLGDGCFQVGAGFPFSRLGTQTARLGWTGLEFASGIPASVGGAVMMNAGANGQETADYLQAVMTVDRDGRQDLWQRNELSFAYRSSPFQGTDLCIVEARFQLQADASARQRQLGLLAQRKASQPLAWPSAGCVFRNPVGESAGRLIEQAGLKGLRIGGAEVSPIHANFIVNCGGATAADVQAIIEEVRARVQENSGHILETEIRPLGPKGGAE